MNKAGPWWLILLAMGLVLAACAPAVAPALPPATPQASPPPPAPAAPQDAEWAKVVAAARKEGRLTIYSFFLSGDTGIQVKKIFAERTGLNLELITGTGAPLIERIKAERRGSFQVASILDSSVVLLYQAKLEGLTQPVGYLPVLKDEAVWLKSPRIDPETHILSTGPSLQTPWVNTKQLKPGEEPRSWKDLLQPQWKGKVDFPDPDTTPSPVRMYYYLTKYSGLDDAYFQQLGKQLVFSANTRLSAEAVARGEVPLAFVQSAVSTGRFVQEGAPIKAIDMAEGVVGILTSPLAFLNGAPHPNAARVFINWLLSQEGQSIYHKYNSTNSFRKDVPPFEPPPAQLSPKKTIWATADEELQVAKVQRDRVLKKLVTGK